MKLPLTWVMQEAKSLRREAEEVAMKVRTGHAAPWGTCNWEAILFYTNDEFDTRTNAIRCA